MKTFVAPIDIEGHSFKAVAVIAAYNRGHAVNLLKRSLKAAGHEGLAESVKSIPVTELDMENRKGTVVFHEN